MASETDRYLPGHPAPKLVRDVRRHLKHYGITPKFKEWRLAWQWAAAVKNSYYLPRWPSPNEIGAQYVVLLLADMKGSFALKLPFRASTHAPAEVQAALGAKPAPALSPSVPTGAGPKALPAATLFDVEQG